MYIDASYSSHAPLIKEHALKNVLVLPAWTPLTSCLPDCRNYQSGRTTNKTLHSRCQSARHSEPIRFTGNLCFQDAFFGGALAFQQKWWRQTGSNRRPEACKATALPTELCPRSVNHLKENMVGLGRLELPTSRLSSARSNQLSYKPKFGFQRSIAT
jgi:hypothetical protein